MFAWHQTIQTAFPALFVLCLPLDVYAQEDAAEPRYGHEFPSMFALKEDWVDFKRDPLPLKAIQALLDKDADGSHVVSPSDIMHSSAWIAVDRWLKQHPDVLAALRKEQNTAAPAKLFVAKRSGDVERLTQIYRSYPWADVVHQSLIDTANQSLRDGNAQLALRCFQDVLERSDDAELLAGAQAGVWLAAAHAPDFAAGIKALFHDVDTAARYPWFGQQLSAKEIETKLLAGLNQATPIPGLDALEVRTIQLPDDPPWMGWTGHMNPTSNELFFRHKLRPVVSDKGTVVAGPCLLAWYAGDALDKPAWSKIATMDMHKNRGGVPPKPPFDPLVVGRRIYVRCGKDIAPAAQKRTHFIRMNHHAALNLDFLECIDAFDQHTGKRIWSTKDAAGWRNLFPVNAPIYHDGRLYSLAMLRKAVKIHGWNDGGQILIGGRSPMFLIISDAETGSVLRQRELFAYHAKFTAYNPTPDKTKAAPPPIKPLDLAADGSQRAPIVHHVQLSVYGDRLTMQDGAVYISTGMGAVARCDARDGLIEWVSTYPQLSSQLHDAATICKRHGLPPLVSGRAVVISPRDSVAIFAVDRETGAPLWQKTRIENVAEGDPATAPATTSEKPVTGPTDGKLLGGSLEVLGLFGAAVLVTFDRQLAALEAATGKVLWTRELDAPVERPIKVEGTTLYLATAVDLLKLDGATGKTLQTRAFSPLRSDNGFVWDDKGLIIVNPGKRGISAYVDFEAGRDPFVEPKS
jgi:outer membrane protein assembly factor BamB